MSPLSDQIVHCDHGLMFGECCRCWERKSLRAEAEIARLTAERDALRAALLDIQGKINFSSCGYCREVYRLSQTALDRRGVRDEP